eukprot:NODE_3191_length_694_cov_1476.186047_g2264_i0.p2 GENE.NODE_3191_length_694_cov_1476.186047_g2264_i0~~NODE_3191_length_694_cov_1476.186047_g2264_i0.p2  ORF type:complete len:200 (-),score=96.72 NODE_3191_length_694_cov_1476.186047_g2264_i0:95-640(-)
MPSEKKSSKPAAKSAPAKAKMHVAGTSKSGAKVLTHHRAGKNMDNAKKGPISKKIQRKRRPVWTKVIFHRPYTLRLPGQKKYPRKCGGTASKMGKMDQFRIIRYPLTTEAAMKKIEDNNTLVFVVDIRSNKSQIRRAVQKLYDIKVVKVNTLIRPDGIKKAFVRLNPEYDALDIANKIGIL